MPHKNRRRPGEKGGGGWFRKMIDRSNLFYEHTASLSKVDVLRRYLTAQPLRAAGLPCPA
jgi:hypothetical protein